MSFSLADFELNDLLLHVASERCEKLIDESEMSDLVGLDEKGSIELEETIENEYANGKWEEVKVVYEVEVQVKVKVKSSKVVASGWSDSF